MSSAVHFPHGGAVEGPSTRIQWIRGQRSTLSTLSTFPPELFIVTRRTGFCGSIFLYRIGFLHLQRRVRSGYPLRDDPFDASQDNKPSTECYDLISDMKFHHS